LLHHLARRLEASSATDVRAIFAGGGAGAFAARILRAVLILVVYLIAVRCAGEAESDAISTSTSGRRFSRCCQLRGSISRH